MKRQKVLSVLKRIWQIANTPIPHTPRAWTLLLVGVLMFIGACWVLPILARNLADLDLSNPGFESCTSTYETPPGWFKVGSGGVGVSGCYPSTYSGVWAYIDTPQYSDHSRACQNVALEEGILDLSWWTMCWSGYPCGSSEFQLRLPDAGTVITSCLTSGVLGSTWTNVGCSVSVLNAGDYSVCFSGSGSGVQWLLDDIGVSGSATFPSSCVVSDPGFSSYTSWTHSESNATYSSGQWQLSPGGYIQQDTYFSSTGIYTATIAARNTGSTAIIDFGMYLTSTGPITITSSSWSYYYAPINVGIATTYTVRATANASNVGNVVIDSICFNPEYAPDLPSEYEYCGLSQADLDTTLLQNASLDSGWGYNNPLYGGELWFPSYWNVTFLSLKRSPGYAFSTAAVGLMAANCVGLFCTDDINQQLTLPSNRFNLVMMVRRTAANAAMQIAYSRGGLFDAAYPHTTISNTTLNEWVPVATWFDFGESRQWKIILRGVNSVGDWSAGYDVDEIYAIPGSSPVVCGDSPPPPNPQPIGDCINGNAHMAGPDSSYQTIYGGPVNGVGYPWVWNWIGRMGQLTPWPHVARLFPTAGDNAIVQQYVPAGYGDVGREFAGVIVDHGYDVFGSIAGYQQPTEMGPIQASTATIMIGNPSVSTFSFDVPFDANHPTTTFWRSFTATTGMLAAPCVEGPLGGCNIGFQINNRGGTSALIDIACILPITGTGGPPVDPPGGDECLGAWERSEVGGMGYVEPGTYLLNTIDLMGSYRLWVSGESTGDGSLDVLYNNPATSITATLGAMDIGTGSVVVSTTFVTPPSGYHSGEVHILPSVGITITSACLDHDAIPPIVDPPTPPIVIPIPECTSVNFWMRAPYTETTDILSGTLYSDVNWAEYVSMQSYNYAIYPLVCTTISIANWQVDAYNSLMAFLAERLGSPAPGDSCGTGIWAVLCKLIDALITYIGALFGMLQSIIDLIKLILQIIWQLVELILQLLGRILSLIFTLLASAIGLLSSLASSVTGTDASSYPINCSGDAEGICFGLAAIVQLDELAGNWITIVTSLVVSILTIYLAIYIIGQVRNMMQPGAGTEDGE